MVAIALGLASALAYGSSDFLAGLMSRRLHYGLVSLVAQLSGAVGIFIALPFVGGHPSYAALGWGGLAGLGSGIGTVALYRGLARGQMSVAGPISGVGSAAIPAAAGFLLGERPSAIAIAGIVLALPAVWLVSSGGRGARRGGFVEGAVDGMLAGLGFGVLFLALAQAPRDSGVWPNGAAQVLSTLVIAGFVLLVLRDKGHLHAVPVRRWVGIVVAGLLGVLATVLFLLATRNGLLVVVSVLAALYPGATVLLARVVLHEHAGRVQLAGLGLALVAVVAITLG